MKFKKSKATTIEANTRPDLPGFTEAEQQAQALLALVQAQHVGVDNMARDLEVVEAGLRKEAEILLNEAAHRAACINTVANQISVMRDTIQGRAQPQIGNGASHQSNQHVALN